MKRYFTSSIICIALLATACNKGNNDPTPSGDYNLTTQAEVDGFTATSADNVTIEGAGITNLNKIKLQSVKKLIIKNTGIEYIVIEPLTTVSEQLEISENASLKGINGNVGQYFNGTIDILKNEVLTDIQGLLSAKRINGKITISGNHALGADDGSQPDTYGFNVLRKLMADQVTSAENITLSDNHPDAATDPKEIGQKSTKYKDYTIRSMDDIEAISAPGDSCRNLTVTGPGVDNEVWAKVWTKVTTILGDLVVDGCTFTTTENFFEYMTINGSITLRNLEGYEEPSPGTKLFNSNGFKYYDTIGGDLILENIPYLVHWGPGNSFAQIETIEGSLIVNNCGMQQLAFASLKSVGGDVNISNNCRELYTGFLWNLLTNLQTVGGNFTYSGNDHVNSLNGFEKITSIGGNIEIKDNGTAAGSHEIWYETTADGRGFDLVQEWIDKGYVKKTATIECTTTGGVPVVFTR